MMPHSIKYFYFILVMREIIDAYNLAKIPTFPHRLRMGARGKPVGYRS